MLFNVHRQRVYKPEIQEQMRASLNLGSEPDKWMSDLQMMAGTTHHIQIMAKISIWKRRKMMLEGAN